MFQGPFLQLIHSVKKFSYYVLIICFLMSFFIQSLMTFDDTSRSLLPLDPLRPRAELHRLRDGLQRLHRPLQRRRVSQQAEQSHKSQKWSFKECLFQR